MIERREAKWSDEAIPVGDCFAPSGLAMTERGFFNTLNFFLRRLIPHLLYLKLFLFFKRPVGLGVYLLGDFLRRRPFFFRQGKVLAVIIAYALVVPVSLPRLVAKLPFISGIQLHPADNMG